MEEETGKKPSEYLLASAKVSTGEGDPGGISYGAYQLASKAGTVQEFLETEGAGWAKEFDGLDPIIRGGFGDKWKEIAKRDGDAFFTAQHEYINRSHYKKVVSSLLKDTGLDENTMPAAVKDVVWSTSVQHGKAVYVIEKAIKSLGKLERTNSNYSHDLINAIYDQRVIYVQGNKGISSRERVNITEKRYPRERQNALGMLDRGY